MSSPSDSALSQPSSHREPSRRDRGTAGVPRLAEGQLPAAARHPDSLLITPEGKIAPALDRFLQLFHLEHDGTLRGAYAAMCEAWWTEENGLRGELCSDLRVPNAAERRLLDELGFISPVRARIGATYGDALFMGGPLDWTRERLAHAVEEWRISRFSRLVVLTGTREFGDRPGETLSALLDYPGAKPQWERPVRAVVPTELEMTKMVFAQTAIPTRWGTTDVPIAWLHTKEIEGTDRFTWQRELRHAGTEDTVRSYIERLTPQGEVLVISNQPFVQYQRAVVAALLAENGHSIPCTAIGAGSAQEPLVRYLDQLLRCCAYELRYFLARQSRAWPESSSASPAPPQTGALTASLPPQSEVRARPVEPFLGPESVRHLTEQELTDRNRLFVDGRHEAAAIGLIAGRGATSRNGARLRLNEYYDRALSPLGRFPPSAWDYFNCACNVLEPKIAAGELPSARLFVELSALLQFGSAPQNLDDLKALVLRKTVTGVERDAYDFRQVFDHEGRYHTPGPQPEILGFCDRERITTRVPPRQVTGGRQPLYSVAELYTALRELEDPGNAEGLQRLRQLKERLEPSPHQFRGSRALMVIGGDPAGLWDKLVELEAYTLNAVRKIVASPDAPEPGSGAFVHAVIQTSVIVGRNLDIIHPGSDASGREHRLLTMASIPKVLGVDPPIQFDYVRTDRVTREVVQHYENATYLPYERYAGDLAKRCRVDMEGCREAVDRVRSRYGW